MNIYYNINFGPNFKTKKVTFTKYLTKVVPINFYNIG